MTTAAHQQGRSLLGLRQQPGRLALVFMRMPRPLYHHGWGRLLGHTFLLITHQGRKSGKRRETVTMALTYEPKTREVVVCSAWGPNTEWMQNLRAHPALEIQIGRERYLPDNNSSAESTEDSPGLRPQVRRRLLNSGRWQSDAHAWQSSYSAEAESRVWCSRTCPDTRDDP
jgi:deazaflavin-dependent oxidoreductase (nitroreductase family)